MAGLAVWTLAALLPFAAIAQETITLRDGTTYDGRMTGATERSITFRDNSGQMHRFDVDRVERIQFAGASRANSYGGEYPGNNSYPPAPPPVENQPGNNYPNASYPGAATYPPDSAARPGYSMTLPSGAAISVRVNENIDTHAASQGTSYSAQVNSDITGPDGNVLIPRGAEARLVVRRINDNSLTLDLESVRVNGRIFRVDTSGPHTDGREGLGENNLGENKRTGEFAGAGAAAQLLTHGDQVRVPAESVLTFRLEHPLNLNAA